MSEYDIIDEFGYEENYDYLNDVIEATLKHENVSKAYFDIVFIDDTKMHEMNKEYHGIDRTTDVLSFALEDNDTYVPQIRELGDIFVSIPKMKAQAI